MFSGSSCGLPKSAIQAGQYMAEYGPKKYRLAAGRAGVSARDDQPHAIVVVGVKQHEVIVPDPDKEQQIQQATDQYNDCPCPHKLPGSPFGPLLREIESVEHVERFGVWLACYV